MRKDIPYAPAGVEITLISKKIAAQYLIQLEKQKGFAYRLFPRLDFERPPGEFRAYRSLW